jgi:hypothetical protein
MTHLQLEVRHHDGGTWVSYGPAAALGPHRAVVRAPAAVLLDSGNRFRVRSAEGPVAVTHVDVLRNPAGVWGPSVGAVTLRQPLPDAPRRPLVDRAAFSRAVDAGTDVWGALEVAGAVPTGVHTAAVTLDAVDDDAFDSGPPPITSARGAGASSLSVWCYLCKCCDKRRVRTMTRFPSHSTH